MSLNSDAWSDIPQFADWKLIPSTFTVSDDGTATVYFILSPDGKYCALVRNDSVRAQFGARGARQVLGIGCEVLFADSFEAEVSGSDIDTDQAVLPSDDDDDEDDFEPSTTWGVDDEDELEGSAAADAAISELELEDLEVVDFTNLAIHLSPTGGTLFFNIQKNENSFIFRMEGEQRAALIAGELMSIEFAECTDHYLLSLRSDDGEDYFILNGSMYDGFVHDSGFSDCGSHSIALVGSEQGGAVSVYVNGKVVVQTAKVQSWNYLGDGGTDASSKIRFLFDPKCRYLLFAIGEQDPDGGPSSVKRSLQVITLADLKVHAWPEIRILNAAWCEQTNRFKLSVLIGADGFRKPHTMSVPHFDN